MTTKVTSTTFCEDPNCPGHRTTREVDGTIVLTNDPALPLSVVPDNEEG